MKKNVIIGGALGLFIGFVTYNVIINSNEDVIELDTNITNTANIDSKESVITKITQKFAKKIKV